MKSKIIEEQLAVYRDNFIQNADSKRGTYQNDEVTQYLRFDALLRTLLSYKPHAFSIHDVGSGVCDLHQFILNQELEHTYSGTEIVQEMIDTSMSLYPNIKLFNRDILSNDINDKYDFVVLSGTFNIPGNADTQEWKKFIFLVIEKMYRMSSCGIAFNFLSTYKNMTNPDLFYLDPKEVFDFCMCNLSRFVTLDHSYPLYEVTVTVINPDFMESKYSQDALKKYFKNKSPFSDSHIR